jgi:uncharacterized protein DUF3455
MNYNPEQCSEKTGQIWVVLAALLALLAWVFGMATWAAAQISVPKTPAIITPPPGNRVFLVGHAAGTQGYVCLPTHTGASWTVTASRPEATLFAGATGHEAQIMTHFLSPVASPNEFAPKPLPFGSDTWQSSLDGSKVWAQELTAIPAGSDASCPHAGAIGCLLLQSIGSARGSAGGKIITGTSFIQRLNTQGGAPPPGGCSGAADVGKQTLVPYTADYYFFAQTNKPFKTRRKFEFF